MRAIPFGRLAACLLLAFGLPSAAVAQSSPGFSYGQVPTAGQWNAAFASKQDRLTFTPLNQAGGTMVGKLQAAPATVNGAGFSLLPGIAPTAPSNGDLWVSGGSLFARLNGLTTALAPLSNPTFSGTTTTPQIAITGPGSTGDVSGMSVTPADGITRALSAFIPLVIGNFDTLAAFKAAKTPYAQTVVTTGGYATAGDGGGARYQRISAPSSAKAWQFQIADGSWWSLIGDDVDVRALGAACGPWSTAVSSLPNDYVALQAAIDYVGFTGGRVRLPGALRCRTDAGLVARVNWQTSPAATDSSIHFKDNSTFDLVSAGGGAIVAGASMNAVLTFQYNSALNNIGPFLSKIEGWTIDGNGMALNGILSDYTMHLNVTRNRVKGTTGGALSFNGYGVARIWGNVLSGYRGISLQGGGGDTWIGPNDYYPNANGAGVSIGKFGGNTVVDGGVFSGEGLAGIIGVDISADGNTTDIVRHITVQNAEFSGMNVGVRATKSSSARNVYALAIRGNHVTPAAGGAVHTGMLAYLTGIDEAIIEGNFGNSSHQSVASSSFLFAFDCASLQVRNNRIANYNVTAIYLNNVRWSAIAGNDIQDTSQGGSGGVIIDLDGGSANNDIVENIIRQTSSSYAQNGIYERAGATGNFGRNRVSGVGTPATIASGSTSTYSNR